MCGAYAAIEISSINYDVIRPNFQPSVLIFSTNLSPLPNDTLIQISCAKVGVNYQIIFYVLSIF